MDLTINLLIILTFVSSTIQPVWTQFHFAGEGCRDEIGNYATNSTYQTNLNLLLSNLNNQSTFSHYKNYTIGQGIDQTYGLFMCRPDQTNQQCQNCVSRATTEILALCPVQKEAIIWYFECVIRYSNHSIFSRYEENSPRVFRLSAGNFSDPEKFGPIFSETVSEVISMAAYNTSTSNRGFGAAEANVTMLETLYIAAQCTPGIIGNQCERCLRVALRYMQGCCGTSREFVDMFLTSCWLRYGQAPIVGDVNGSSSVSPSPPISPISPIERSPPPVLQPSPGGSTGITITPGSMSFIFEIILMISISSIMDL
ncbi:unnamed protein product [Amaranthus hypochondriacus]